MLYLNHPMKISNIVEKDISNSGNMFKFIESMHQRAFLITKITLFALFDLPFIE